MANGSGLLIRALKRARGFESHHLRNINYLLNKEKMKQEFSAGGVVYRVVTSDQEPVVRRKIEFLLGKHSGYHKWVLPKGLVEKGESPMEAAVREVEEEVGVRARITEMSPIGTHEYFYYADFEESLGKGANGKITTRRVKKYQEDGGGKIKVKKRVVFYLMEMEEDLGNHGWEMEERKWVGPEEGLKLLAFEDEKRVLQEAIDELAVK